MQLTLAYAYYNNPNMLRRQLEEWLSYPEAIRQELEIIVTDDCSDTAPLKDILPFPAGLNIRAFRVLKKKPWNWLACRNIGAHYASGTWVLLTDMDHMLQRPHMEKLMAKLPGLHENTVYLFTRVSAPDDSKYKPHDDSFLMTKSMYWKIGGYDEELSGNYGTSGRYRRRAFERSEANKRLFIPLTRYGREVIPDASTTTLKRKEGRDPYAIGRIEALKRREGRENEIRTLSFPYEEIA